MGRVPKLANQKPISSVSKEPSGFKKSKKAKEAANIELLRKQAALFFLQINLRTQFLHLIIKLEVKVKKSRHITMELTIVPMLCVMK